jgi:hypothetical protein
MKTGIYAFLCFILLSSALFSQVPYYYYQVPSGTTNDLYDIKGSYFSSSYSLISGANGTLLFLFSSDSAWRQIPTGATSNLNSFEKIENGSSVNHPYFIFGNSGVVVRNNSYNGYNWFSQYCGFPNNLYGGAVIGNNINARFIALGANGILLRKMCFPSFDTNWLQIQSGTTYNLKSICSKGRFGWIVGEYGIILYTIDTGNTWNQQFSFTTNNLNSVSFLDSLTGFAAGNGGTILKTSNGGVNWYSKISGTNQNLNCVFSLSSNRIFVAGNKTVLYSTDAGETFTLDSGVPQYNLYGCDYIYSNIYGTSIPYFVGEGGRIFRKTLDTIYHPNILVQLDGNNISAYFAQRGVFDINASRYGDLSGFIWPKGSGKTAIFTAGLCIGAFVNGQLREAMASYSGEYSPGYCVSGNYYTNIYFKIYKISRGDNSQTSWDWANWGQMVPYGAPFVDVNHNGIYELAVDTPGVSGASQTIFYCMTDANPSSHSSGNGFGGGTQPLGAEVHIIAWTYETPGLADVQFISFDVLNKSTSSWNSVKMGIFYDPDLGDANDDYLACDTSLRLGIGYNADNYDAMYGTSPPAVGILMLRSPLNRSVTPNVRLGLSSFVYIGKASLGYPQCETDAGGLSYQAYLYMSGFKNDSTCWVDPTQVPPKKTKFCYPGDPETNAGWTEVKGSIKNCNHDSTGSIYAPNPPSDRKFVLNSGANNFTILPGESQKFVIAQLIARDSGNLKSVTKLKSLAASVRTFYENNFPIGVNQISSAVPQSFYLFPNYPNPFNPTTTIKYQIPVNCFVSLKVYDILGKEIITLVNEAQTASAYEVSFDGSSLSSGIYFYKLVSGDFVQTRKMVLIK